jgi:4-hydroxyproline epimerase
VGEHGQRIAGDNLEALTAFTWALREALREAGITGRDGAEIDHIELFAHGDAGSDSRNFVLCPGEAYDRSPCGTGTSAKIACLAADGLLAPGEVWRQSSVIGSLFEASYVLEGGQVIPTIRGRAHMSAEATLLIDDADPFAWGIAAS